MANWKCYCVVKWTRLIRLIALRGTNSPSLRYVSISIDKKLKIVTKAVRIRCMAFLYSECGQERTYGDRRLRNFSAHCHLHAIWLRTAKVFFYRGNIYLNMLQRIMHEIEYRDFLEACIYRTVMCAFVKMHERYLITDFVLLLTMTCNIRQRTTISAYQTSCTRGQCMFLIKHLSSLVQALHYRYSKWTSLDWIGSFNLHNEFPSNWTCSHLRNR